MSGNGCCSGSFTGLLVALMVCSAARALLDYAWAWESFEHLGYPTYIIVPLEIAKLLGVAAVVSSVSPFLKHLAYAGFLYHLLLALSAHVAAGDRPEMMAASASGLALLAGSFQFRPQPDTGRRRLRQARAAGYGSPRVPATRPTRRRTAWYWRGRIPTPSTI